MATNDTMTQLTQKLPKHAGELFKFNELCPWDVEVKGFCWKLIGNIRLRRHPKGPKDLLIFGPEGTGKFTLANLIARCCCCARLTPWGACGTCSMCRRVPFALTDDRDVWANLHVHLRGNELAEDSFKEFWQKTTTLRKYLAAKKQLKKSSTQKTPRKNPKQETAPNENQVRQGYMGPVYDLTRLKVIVVEGIDEASKEVQEFLFRDYIIRYEKTHWLLTASDQTKVIQSLQEFIPWDVTMGTPNADVFLQFLRERFQCAGVPHRPIDLHHLAEHCQKSGKMFRTAKKFLEFAVEKHMGLEQALLAHDSLGPGAVRG